MFSDEIDETLLYYIAKKIGHRQAEFVRRFYLWKRNNFLECRGRHRISLAMQQLITDE